MAGIGFELRKVISRGGISSFLQTAMSGAMIVAGPWILSIVTITLIQSLIGRAPGTNLEIFMGVIIYCYAFSLFLFGGFHYLFTRRMSDLLYLKRDGEAFGYVLRLCIPIIIISVLISLYPALSLGSGAEFGRLLSFSAVLLFTSVNCIWILMLFVSVLKWYIRILIAYGSGLLSSALLIYLLSKSFGTAGAVLGFASGHVLILVLLLSLCRAAYKPEKPAPPPEIKESSGNKAAFFFRYLGRHRFLFGAGLLYYWGIWIDKFIFWKSFGETVPGTFIRLFPSYDIPVFMANLTMIPGLVFFVIYSETEFYTALKNFLHKLGRSSYPEILKAKTRLSSVTRTSIKEQSLLQAVVTIAVLITAGGIIIRTTLVAVFFHLLFLTLLNYLFYIEQYRRALRCSAVFFTVNTAGAILISIMNLSEAAGLSYLVSAAAAAGTALLILKNDISTLERHILTKK